MIKFDEKFDDFTDKKSFEITIIVFHKETSLFFRIFCFSVLMTHLCTIQARNNYWDYLNYYKLNISPESFISCENKQEFVMDTINEVFPFDNVSVKLDDSWIQKRELLTIQYLKSLDPDRLLHNFRINSGLESHSQPLSGWESPSVGLRGHFVGHYLSAVSYLVGGEKDTLLATRLDYMINELDKCQQNLGKGYLSAFPESDFDVLESEFTGVWAPYYTYHKIMQGLLDAFIYTGNIKAYNMVLRMADYVAFRMSKLDTETINRMLCSIGANPQNESGAMNEVLYALYRISREEKYLALAKLFDVDWLLTPLSENRDILSGLHANTHLVLVNGFAEAYQVTGNKKYYNAVVNFWNMLLSSHCYVNGSSSGPRPIAVTPVSITSEHWGVPDRLSNTLTGEIAESCVTHNTQKLTSTLFSWTAQPIYADAYMNTFYNAVLPLQSANTGACVYHLPLGSPRKKKFLREDDFKCCNGTSIETFSKLNKGIYYHDENDIWVNMYVPSTLCWDKKKLKLIQLGDFPKSNSMDLTLSLEHSTDFSLNLFIPSWAKYVTVYVNEEKYTHNSPLSYFCLKRKWNSGDKITVCFDFEFYAKSMPDDKNVVALYYGPILLAFESVEEVILKGSVDDILNGLKCLDKHNGHFSLNTGDNHFLLKPFFDIEQESYGVYATFSRFDI